MIYFKKLNIDFSEIKKIKKMKIKLARQISNFISYDLLDINAIDGIIRKKIKLNIEPTRIDIIKHYGENLCFHTDDIFPTVSLNFYLKTNGERTVFLKKTSSENTGNLKDIYVHYPNMNMENHYAAEFVANDNDVYLLNTGEIHGVIRKSPKDVRIMLRYFWENYTLDEIYNSIVIFN